MRRRDFLRLSLAGAAGLAAAACSRRVGIPSDVPVALQAAAAGEAERGARAGLMVFPGGQEFVAGRTQRLPLGLVDPEGFSITGGSARAWVAAADGEAGAPAEALYHAYGTVLLRDDPRGFHVATIALPPPGLTDVLVSIETGERALYGWTTVQTRAEPATVDVGERAVPVDTPTTEDHRGVANLCTREPACPLHDRTLRQMLAAARPVVYTISSPLLCTSRTCGPVLGEVLTLHRRYGARAAFVHAEPYRGEEPTQLAPAATAWRLESEPWTFVIDAGGVVRARFEGPVVADEIDNALRPLL